LRHLRRLSNSRNLRIESKGWKRRPIWSIMGESLLLDLQFEELMVDAEIEKELQTAKIQHEGACFLGIRLLDSRSSRERRDLFTMNSVLIVAIVFGGIVLALAIVGSTILMAIRILKGGFTQKSRNIEAEEARMIQQIYQGLSAMEKRVDSFGDDPPRTGKKGIRTMRRFERVFNGRIYRSRQGIIMGVCKGVADHFDLSVFWTRAITLILLFVTGFWPMGAVYFAAALLMKPEPAVPPGPPGRRTFMTTMCIPEGRPWIG
jgi:phage shock protein PspC (stress-responsive transcriptional regulator)